ncbi:sensor histidine kinase [Promicromonospora sp. NPDC019610]|uniref:sensor histidine kinase n=1 Tax=Promicromonospora sp. NPDC019610 TaxID=3364405 RepID=UPI0037BAABB0
MTGEPQDREPGGARTEAARTGTGRPPRRTVVVAMLLLGTLTLATVLSRRPSGPEAQPLELLDLAVAVVSLALLPLMWARRSVPVALTLAALAVLSPGATPAATSGVLQIARWSPLRTAVLVAAASTAAHALQGLWRPPAFPLGWWLLCDVAVHAALLGWGAYLQARAQLLADLRARARRAEADREQALETARSGERNRIAAEMHDALGHRLSLLAATAGAVEYRPDAPPEQLAGAAGRVRTGAAEALEDLRQLVRLLRGGSDRLAPPPTLRDIPGLVDAARSVGATVTLDRTDERAPAGPGEGPEDIEPSPAVAIAAYRVVQEGLTNARRHAPGAAVRVAVITHADEVRVVVADDGPERAPGAAPGTGLVGLRERVELLGGTLDAGRSAGGFTLEARIPWA